MMKGRIYILNIVTNKHEYTHESAIFEEFQQTKRMDYLFFYILT